LAITSRETDHTISLVLAEVMQAAGLRAFVGKLSMDISSRPSYVEASARESLSAAESFVKNCHALSSHLPEHRRLVEPVITPRFVPSCSDDLLAGLGAMSEAKSLRIQSHLAEAHDQIEWVKRERGVDDIEIFDRVSRYEHFVLFDSTLKGQLPARTPDSTYNSSTLYICGLSVIVPFTDAGNGNSALSPF